MYRFMACLPNRARLATAQEAMALAGGPGLSWAERLEGFDPVVTLINRSLRAVLGEDWNVLAEATDSTDELAACWRLAAAGHASASGLPIPAEVEIESEIARLRRQWAAQDYLMVLLAIAAVPSGPARG